MAPPGYSGGSSSNLNYKPKVIHSSLAASLLGGSGGGGGAGGSSGANRRGSPSSSPAAAGPNRFARSMQPTGAASRGSAGIVDSDESGADADAGRYDAAANGERAQRPSNQLSGLINGRSSGMLGAQRASKESGSLMGLSGNSHHQSNANASTSSSSSAAAAPAAKKQRVIVEDSDDTDASSPVKPSGAHFASYRYDPHAHKASSSLSRPSAPSGAGSKRPRADEDEGQSRPSKASGREGHGRPIVLDDEESDALERSGADSEALRAAASSAKPRAPAPAAVKPKPRFRLGGRRSASKTPEPIAIPSSPVESPGASSDAEVQVVGSRDAAGSGGSGAASDVSVEEKRRRRVRGLMVQHAGVPIAEIEQTLVRCQDQLPAALKALAAAGKHESLPSSEDRTDPQGLNSKERRDTYAALDAEFGGRLRKGSEAVMRTLVRHRWSHKASKEYLATLMEAEREESKRRPAPAAPRSTESDSTSRSFPIASSEPDTEDPLDLINTATRKPQKMPMRPAVVLTKQQPAAAAAASSSMSRASSSASASSRVSTAANPREQLREKQKQQHSSRRHADAISIDSNESGSEGDADEDEEDDDDDDDSDGSEAGPRESRRHESALNWFNTAAASELMDTINISEAQATTLLSMRPFTSVSDVEERLGDRKAKGVTPRLFTNCIELMAGYNEVDQVLERCERIGRKLMNDMGAWNLDSAHTAASTRESTPALASAADDAAGSSSASSRASTPGIGGGGDSKKIVPDLRVTALAREKARKAGFLERQPRNMAKDLVLKDYQLIGVNWLSLLYSHKTVRPEVQLG